MFFTRKQEVVGSSPTRIACRFCVRKHSKETRILLQGYGDHAQVSQQMLRGQNKNHCGGHDRSFYYPLGILSQRKKISPQHGVGHVLSIQCLATVVKSIFTSRFKQLSTTSVSMSTSLFLPFFIAKFMPTIFCWYNMLIKICIFMRKSVMS